MFWLWRLFATALSFMVFGLGGVMIPLLAMPILYLMPGDKATRERRSRLLVHLLFKSFIHLIRFLRLMRWETQGSEKLQRPGTLILANHPTLIDIVFLVAFIPNASCIVKGRLMSNPVMRGFISLTGYITNDRGPGLIIDAHQTLQSGSCLVIFPEGTRTSQGGPTNLHRGAANIAVRCRTNITPVLIRCQPSTLSKKQPWYHIPPKPFVLSFDVMDDIPIAPYLEDTSSRSARGLTRYLEQFFRNLL